ncbi:MAG: ATP-binding protein [Verrucomicrobiae bacterium]|nr:ATP-binding protein [Verrucomicrobiae bacterium]
MGAAKLTRFLGKLTQLRLSERQREAQLRRIMLVETNVMLPIKFVAFVAAAYFYQNEMRGVLPTATAEEAAAIRAYMRQLNFYGIGNLIFWSLLLAARLGRMMPQLFRFSAFWLAMLDMLFLSGLIYFTGGLESVLFWLYIGLMVRNAVNFPVFWQQIVMNVGATVFYTLSVMLHEEQWGFFGEELYWLRVMVLVLASSCCWGVYVLLQREWERARTRHELEVREQTAAASGRLAAELAHQLKNPLGIINNAAFVLQRQTATSAAIREPVEVIRQEVSRCDRILTQLLDYARLSEGRVEPVEFNSVLERALKQALAATPGRWEVRRRYAAGLPVLWAHRTQIEESFLNVIQNALEAMPGGGTLTLETRYAGDGQVEVRIADTGVGMSATEQERIFEAFYTTKPKGSGLGLAIVKNIVETYGGRIAVRSEPGKGTEFTLVFPTQITKETETL